MPRSYSVIRRSSFWSLFTIGDFVSVALITTVAVVGLVIDRSTVEGSMVRVYCVGGEYTFGLGKKGKKSYEGPLGKTIVEPTSHGVRISKSPCNKQICVRQGLIHHEGEMIACIPNKVVVTVIGKNEAYDGLSR